MFWLWFDVGIKRYTTGDKVYPEHKQLWFDVGIKRYTTRVSLYIYADRLWFDVGIKRYTTAQRMVANDASCGLM